MPRRNQNRKSDDPVWATFKIPYEKWQHFKAVAKAEGNTASATLVDLIEGYLTSESINNSKSESSAEIEDHAKSHHDSLAEAFKQTFLNSDDLISKIVNQKIAILEQSFADNLEKKLEKIVQTRLSETVSQSLAGLDQELNQELKRFLEKVDQLEKELQSLQKQVENQKKDWKNGQAHTSSSVNSSVNSYKATKLIDIEAIAIENLTQESKDDVGLTQEALCEQFGINSTKVTSNARLRNLSTPEYLYQVTGWVYRKGIYYPPKF